jgi:hypothetical protein
MSAATVNLIVRGRIAWILGILLGIGLLLAGAFMGPNVTLLIAGGAFVIFSVVMLILSFVTAGRSD